MGIAVVISLIRGGDAADDTLDVHLFGLGVARLFGDPVIGLGSREGVLLGAVLDAAALFDGQQLGVVPGLEGDLGLAGLLAAGKDGDFHFRNTHSAAGGGHGNPVGIRGNGCRPGRLGVDFDFGLAGRLSVKAQHRRLYIDSEVRLADRSLQLAAREKGRAGEEAEKQFMEFHIALCRIS